jgi:hypothetical protein
VVSFTINFVGGAAQFEAANKVGLANITASMMREGTTTRSGDQISEALELLGVGGIGVNVDQERGSIGFFSTKAKLAPTLDVLADLLLHPSFPPDALGRLKGQVVTSLTSAKDQPGPSPTTCSRKCCMAPSIPTVASTRRRVSRRSRARRGRVPQGVFPAGARNHNGRRRRGSRDDEADGGEGARAVDRGRQSAVVLLSSGAGSGGDDDLHRRQAKGGAVGLRDRSGRSAAQHARLIRAAGHEHDPGGIFQSRLQHNIREEKGWSYGVSSRFAFGKGPGAFRGGGGMTTAKTDSALMEFMKELRGVQGSRPFTDEELAQGRAALAQALPSAFATVSATGNSIASIYLNDLPQDYYQTYASKINAVTKDDLVRVAKKYIDLDHLNILIVGDRSVIEEPLRKTGIAPIVILDINGNRVGVTP